ncbi:putative Ig domain-containing protein [Rudanella paleaurantiibacter]|uniref:putative Ig domain-containing protein n=1 Tax=Rudanella paleaurantiibacter TaxID=2614655 RepID=UPI00162A40D7|nr:putative Ig domain-containing protein [Rudanella paleaurantiibacter]
MFNTAGDRKGTLKVYGSTDNGASFTDLNADYTATNNVAGSANVSVQLPAAFNNAAQAIFRLYYYNGGTPVGSTGSRPKIAIDNLTVTGFENTVTLASSNSLNCELTSATITAAASATDASTTYAFSAGATPVAQNSNQAVVNTAGPHSVVVNTTGYVSSSATITITVDQNPPVVTVSPSATAICNGSSVGLTASGAVSYTWSTGANTASITVNPTSTTTYTVTGANAGGCTSFTTVTVTVNSFGTAPTLTPSGTLGCGAPTITLTATPAGAANYVFTGPAAVTASGATATVNTPGTYTVTVTDANGCSATATATVTGTGGGCPVQNVTKNLFYATIQAAVSAASPNDLIYVPAGTYDEMVIIDKPLSLSGQGTSTNVTFTGTVPVSALASLFTVASADVTIQNFGFTVDLSKTHSAIHTTGNDRSNLRVLNNTITPVGTPISGQYGRRNAIAINPNIGLSTATLDNDGFGGVVVQGNRVNAHSTLGNSFRAAVQIDLSSGIIGGSGAGQGNSFTAINHDVVARFTNQGDITIEGNTAGGGGIQISDPNPGAGNITVSNNTFNGTFAQPTTGVLPSGALLRIQNNGISGTKTLLVQNNTFSNHRWAISAENNAGFTITGNTFTPNAAATDYRHISVNTKLIASNSATLTDTQMQTLGGTISGNTFNGSSTPNSGTAIAFLNHRTAGAKFGAFTIGSSGSENQFNAAIGTFVMLDNSTGASSGYGSPFGDYAGVSSAITTMGPWATDLDIRNNRFDIGGGLTLPSAFDASQRATLETRLFHKPDDAAVGRLLYFDPVRNLTQNTFFPTIQSAVNAANAGDVIQAAEATFNERVTIDKSLTLQGASKTATILDGTGLSGTGSGISINSGVTNVTIRNLTVQKYVGNGPNSSAGIYAAQGNNNLVVSDVQSLSNSGGAGFYANGPVQSVTVTSSTFSGHDNSKGAARGIVIWNGFKQNIYIVNNTVTNNNCCGIELQDGTASGVTITGNTITDNGDNGIGVTGLQSGAGANLIANNTITNNGRFGIEVKLPNGTGATSGDGSIVVENNTVTRSTAITDARDIGGIVVIRRGFVIGNNNVDIPTGVVVRNNTVSGYQQPSTSDGFGIVVEGIGHTVQNNSVQNNDVGIQQQAGHGPYAANAITDGDQSNLADSYFGRGNSPATCGNTVSGNTFSGNGVDARNVGNVLGVELVTNTNTGQKFCSIQSAIDAAGTQTGHTLQVSPGTYSEQVLVNKGVRIVGSGTPSPVLNFTGTVTGKPTIFDVSADGVSIEGLTFSVDLAKLKSAIIASGASIDNIAIKNNTINGYGTPASGTYTDRNAVSVNFNGNTAYRVATGGVNSVTFTGNTVTGTAPASYFRSGISADEVSGTFTGNTLTSINQDIQIRFNSVGAVTISNNTLNGGGVEFAEPNAGSGQITIASNTFNAAFANAAAPNTAVLRLKNNQAGRTVVVEGNTFSQHQWGISQENFNTVTYNNNTFTPLANSTTFRHLTVNTKSISSNSPDIVLGNQSATLTNNTFNGSGTPGGTGVAFYNHDTDNPTFGTITFGTTGNANTFNAGISTFIRVDNSTGPSATGASSPFTGAAGFPEYGGSIRPTNMGPWTPNIDIRNNRFDLGSGAQLPSTFNASQRATLETLLFHKPDDAAVGQLIYFDPVRNLTQNTFFPTIQAAVNAANVGDVIEAAEYTFNERVTIDKSLTLQGASKTATILDGTGLSGTGSGISINSGVTNVTIRNLTVQKYVGNGPNSSAGIYAAQGNNNLVVSDVQSLSNSGGAGFYANGPVQSVTVTSSTFSGHDNSKGAARGIVIWNGFKQNIYIVNNTVTNNNCCGIELQDGTASGVTITGNTVTGNGDSGIGLTGLKGGAGANLIAGNTISNNGRFGIEIKNPNGTGTTSGDGSIVVENNTVSFAASPSMNNRDHAGISVYRRGMLPNNTEGYPDVPTGVVIRNNTVTGFQHQNQVSAPTESEGFGIVIEGRNHTVTGNTLNNNNIGIQQQGGLHPAANYVANNAGDGLQDAGASPAYFGRGNSPTVCNNTVDANNFSGNTTDVRYSGPAAFTVTALAASATACIGQPVELSAQTLNGTAPYSFTWAAPAGATVNATNLSAVTGTLSASGTQTFTVNVQDTYGCATSATVVVTGKPLPVATLVGPAEICTGNSLTLTAGGGVSYVFSPNVVSSTGNTAVINTAGVYSVTATNSDGCTASKSLTVTESAAATATLSSATLTCAQTSVTLTATGGNSYTLSDGQTNTTGIFSVSTAGSYTVTVTNAGGCTATASSSVTLNNTQPTLTISPSATTICAGTSANLTASGAVSYTWSTGVSTAAISVSPTATTVYSVTGTNAIGCTGTASVTVTVNSIPDVTVAVSPSQTVCAGTSVTLTANAPAGSTYRWAPGLINNTSASFAPLLPLNTTTTYSVTVTNAGCRTTISTQVTVNPRPTVSVSPAAASICSGQSVTLTANATGTGPFSYTWTNAPAGQQNNPFIVVEATGTYSVRVTDANGCTPLLPGVSGIVTIGLPAAPVVSSTNNFTACEGTPVSLSASCVTNTTARWRASDGTITNASTLSSPTTAGTYNYTVVCVASGIGYCESTSILATATVSAAPVVSLAGPALVCSGSSATLTASATTPGTTYVFSSNVVSSAGNTAVINAAGTYSVTATASGCSSTTSLTVGAGTTPTASLTNSGVLSCSNTTVTLTATGGTSYSLSNGQSNTTGIFTVSTAGTYTVTVGNGDGCTSTATTTVTSTTNAITATLVASGTISCANPSVTLTASPSGLASYVFSAGATQIGGSTGNTATVTTAGTYSVTITDAGGCSAVAQVTVMGSSTSPVASLTASGVLSCSTTFVALTASPAGAVSYAFSAGATQIGGSAGNTATVTTPGIYSVVITGANGCTTSASVTVMGSTTAPTVSLANNGTITCNNTSVTLTATPAGQGTYVFSAGATQIGGSTGNTATVSAGGTYTVVVTAANGCTASATTTVESATNAVNATLAASGTLTCAQTSVTLTATGGTSYSLSNGQSNTTGIFTVSTAGTYTVTVSNAGNCTATATATVMSSTAGPAVTIAAMPGTAVTMGQALTLTASGATGYTWSTGATTASINPPTSATGTFTYSVTGTAGNGCSGTATISITVSNTVAPACGSPAGTIGQPLALMEPIYNCQTGQIQFITVGGNGSPITFSAVGITGPTISCTAMVDGQVAVDIRNQSPNVQPFVLFATQNGVTVSYTWNALAACAGGMGNNSPTVVNPVGPQSATVGVPFTLNIGNVFSDMETPNSLVLSVSGLPAGLTFSGTTISGTPSFSGISTVTLRATDPGSLSTGATFTLTVSPASSTTVAPPANTAPTVANAVGPQSATVGTAYSLNVGSVFTDAQTPGSLVLAASGLPAGLSLAGTTISGTPSVSGVVTVTLTATDPGSLSASTSFQLTVSPAASTTTNPPVGGPLAATVVSYNCQTGAIVFGSTGGNGSAVEYLAIGITGWTTNTNHVIEAGLRADPKPVTVRVRQNGVEGTAFVFDFGAFCSGNPQPPTNTAPTVANAVGPQSATVGTAYSLNVGSVFTDAQTPGSLVLAASGLPAGLSLAGTTISGTPSVSGVVTVTLTATDPGSLSASTSFQLTVSPAASTTTNPPVGGPLAATVVSYNCQTGAIVFGSTGGNGSAVEYLAIGITGWTTNTNHVIEAGLRADPKPVTVRVRQNGVEGTAFVFDFGAFCSGNPQPPTNTAPTVANAVGPQSATVGTAYSLNVGSVFTDAQTPGSLVLAASGLPAGLSLAGTTISGTPSVSGVVTVTLTATDPGNLSGSTSFQLTVSPATSGTTTPPAPASCGSPANTLGGALQITGVADVNCQTGTFRILTSGGDGSAISYANIVGLKNADPNNCLRSLDNQDLINAVNNPSSDINPFQLRVTQGATISNTFSFNFKGVCTGGARVASETAAELEVTVMGNPTSAESVEVEVRGVGSEAVTLRVVALQGQSVSNQLVTPASGVARGRVKLGESAGTYLLQVSTPTRTKTVKVVRQ